MERTTAAGAMPFIPYGRQAIDERDIQAVVEVLRGDWLTTGPMVERFEAALARAAGAPHAVALSSGTAALHAAMHAVGVGPGDEVVVPAITFVATANAVLYAGGTPVFADVDPETLLVDPESVRARITPRTKAIVAVDYAGQPCDYDALRGIAREHGLALVSDACHALGATYRGKPVGALADATVLSFHPVKHVTTGEGGMLLAHDPDLAAKARRFRGHGIATDHRQRTEAGTHRYEMIDLGYNYRITDFQCALGLSQLGRLDAWLARRRAIAARYDAAFADLPGIEPLAARPGAGHAYHLYVARFDVDALGASRDDLYRAYRASGIGVNVHYLPVHLHPYYQKRFGTREGLCPAAEAAYHRILSLPMFPAMEDPDVERVVDATRRILAEARAGRSGG